jgi:hypothetical protein
MEPITARELNNRLRKEKSVEVCGMAFRIRCAPLMFLGDETDDFWAIARQGKEALSERIQELIANPKLPQFRRVLMNGIVSPKISVLECDGEFVTVDTLLSDYALSVGLYVEIVRFTLEQVPKEGLT